MTTYASKSVVCGACGHVFEITVLGSTNSFGSPDLDTRPAGMQRSTMDAWIHRCPACGFCAQDITQFDESSRTALASPAYRAQLDDQGFPALATNLLCAEILADAAGQQSDSCWDCLHAAWVLKDQQDDEHARACRGRTADRILALLAEGQTFAKQAGASEAIAIDCLRRAGRGEEALPIIERALGQSFVDVINTTLLFQKALIERADTSRHTIQEAIAPPA